MTEVQLLYILWCTSMMRPESLGIHTFFRIFIVIASYHIVLAKISHMCMSPCIFILEEEENAAFDRRTHQLDSSLVMLSSTTEGKQQP